MSSDGSEVVQGPTWFSRKSDGDQESSQSPQLTTGEPRPGAFPPSRNRGWNIGDRRKATKDFLLSGRIRWPIARNPVLRHKMRCSALRSSLARPGTVFSRVSPDGGESLSAKELEDESQIQVRTRMKFGLVRASRARVSRSLLVPARPAPSPGSDAFARQLPPTVRSTESPISILLDRKTEAKLSRHITPGQSLLSVERDDLESVGR